MQSFRSTCQRFGFLSLSTPAGSLGYKSPSLAFFGTKHDNVEALIPKKPPTSFMRFMEDNRPLIKATHPNLKASEVSKMVGERWSTLQPEKKNDYQSRAESELIRWKEEKAKIMADPALAEKLEELKKQKAEKMLQNAMRKANRTKKALVEDIGRPKRPANAYALYVKDKTTMVRNKLAAQGNQVSTTEVMSVIGINWKNESEDVKAKYNAEVEAKMEVYKKELEAWKAKNAENEDLIKVDKKLKSIRDRKKKLQTN